MKHTNKFKLSVKTLLMAGFFVSILSWSCNSDNASENTINVLAERYDVAIDFKLTRNASIGSNSIPIVFQDQQVYNASYTLEKVLTNADSRIDLDVFKNDGVTLHAEVTATNGTPTAQGGTLNGSTLTFNLTDAEGVDLIGLKAGNNINDFDTLFFKYYVQKEFEDGIKKGYFEGDTFLYKVIEKPTLNTPRGYTAEPFLIASMGPTIGSPRSGAIWTKVVDINISGSICSMPENECTSKLYTYEQMLPIMQEFDAIGYQLPPNSAVNNYLREKILYGSNQLINPYTTTINIIGKKSGSWGPDPIVPGGVVSLNGKFELHGIGEYAVYWAKNTSNNSARSNAVYIDSPITIGQQNIPRAYGASLFFYKPFN